MVRRKSKLFSSIAWSVALLVIVGGCSNNEEGSQADSGDHKSSQKSARSCEVGTPTEGKFYIKKDETPFYLEPDKNSGKVVNSRATEVLGRTQYRDLWTAMVLEGLCETPEWLQAKIVEADGSPVDWEAGWVEKSKVRTDASSDQKLGLIWNIDGEEDFSSSEKSLIREGALRVLRDEDNCKSIITGYRSGSRKGQIYVTCNAKNGREPFNVWFSLDDVRSNKSLSAPTALDESISRKLCIDAIKGNVNHPSTLDINTITGYATRVANNGNREIIQTFSAKNSFGLKLSYRARCLVMPDGKLEIAINEEK